MDMPLPIDNRATKVALSDHKSQKGLEALSGRDFCYFSAVFSSSDTDFFVYFVNGSARLRTFGILCIEDERGN